MNTDSPRFSIIINTINRAQPLQTLLCALEKQSYPDFEVVIVVGPTKDNTMELLDNYGDRVKVLRCPSANLGVSRNIGLLASSGDIVAYIDDDAVPSHRWLEQLAGIFEDPWIGATGGIVYLIHPNHPRLQHSLGLFSSLAEQVDVRSSWLEHLVPPGIATQWVTRMMGTNMAYRRADLIDIGGFDEFYEWVYDETDVAMRFTIAGKILHPVKQAPVYHVPASSHNRQVFTYNLKWWLQTRASVYSAVKNGTASGESRSTIIRRCMNLIHGHLLLSNQFLHDNKISSLQAWQMRINEVTSGLHGMVKGFSFPRKLIPQNGGQAGDDTSMKASFHQYQNGYSAFMPSVDPINGRQANVRLSEPPLRICLLSRDFPPSDKGGVGRQTHMLAKALFESGQTVHVITKGDRERLTFRDGAYVHEIPTRLEYYEQYKHLPGMYYLLNHSHNVYEKVKDLILNDGIQIIDSSNYQFEGLVTSLSGILPVVIRLVTAMRQIAPLNGDDSDDKRLQGEMERVFIERANHLLPNTHATLRTLQGIYGVHPREDQYSIATYGIEPVPDEKTRPYDLQRSEKNLKVLFLGRLEKRKGIIDLFHAIPSVVKHAPNTRFVIAGADNSHNDGFLERTGMDYRSYFERTFPEYKSMVDFVGEVPDGEPQEQLYQSCDLFVAPSLYESFGLIYIEAMNYSKPVIGCNTGGVPEVVEHGVTGLLVDPQSPKALAEAIATVLCSPVLLRDMGMAGRQRLLTHFTAAHMANNFTRIYRNIITRNSGADHQ